ncbi:hypothetical protein OWV82_023627 [Melia azedarach]|uniref:Uncharacterized protein n=1 Tax=Melia azedarach TaxID=155640 RepID=A0ACC1X0P5_MELAZ|nr:hypothetical protein OWV82_023627 [Melia azedarach]
MAERNNKIQWLEEIGIGIRNRVSGLKLCIDKWDEKITELVMVTEAWKEDTFCSSSTIELFVLKMELEDVKKGLEEILVQYQDACDENREEEEEEEENVMKELKALIIEVYNIKRKIDGKIEDLDIVDHVKGESSRQDLSAKDGGKDHDVKGKGLMIDDSDDEDVVKLDHGRYGESSQARPSTETTKDEIIEGESSQQLSAKNGGKDHDVKGKGLMIDDSDDEDVVKLDHGRYGESSQARPSTETTKDEIIEGESSQDLSAKNGGKDHDVKGKGLMIDDSDDDDLMKFDHSRYGESSQARSLTEMRKDEFLILSSSSEEEILPDDPEEKDGDVKERFLNRVSEAFELSDATSETEIAEGQAAGYASDSDDYEEVGGVEELEDDLIWMQIVSETSSGSSSSNEHAGEEARIFR